MYSGEERARYGFGIVTVTVPNVTYMTYMGAEHTEVETVSSNEYFDLCERSRDLRVAIG